MNCINVSQKNNLVVIKINSEAKHREIISQLKRKILQLEKIYKEEKVPIMVTGKVLKNKEMEEIEALIKKKIDVEVQFDMPKAMGLSNIRKVFKQEISVSETKFHRGDIRCGQRIEDEGSIVIIGDVNSGGEVIAGDNIVVVGALRGLAHAGAKGNVNAIIATDKLATVQLRIANIIKEIDKDEEKLQNRAYIYVDKDSNKMVIE